MKEEEKEEPHRVGQDQQGDSTSNKNFVCQFGVESWEVESLYKPTMQHVKSTESKEIEKRLHKQGIQHKQEIFVPDFTKICIKTDWESTIYQVKYGSFKTILKVIRLNINPKKLCNKEINKGSFGQALRFDISHNQKYVLKNIQYNAKPNLSFDNAFREVLMAKILSALQIGPKFHKIFCYDAIIFQNKVQFCMEFCHMLNTACLQQQITNELKEKKMMSLLKTMHSLKICHLDIKSQNIGWSPTLQKFVLLDFGFTKNIKENIGYKTFTGFYGTYHYCSHEMKKLLLLGEMSYIDLYLNDFYSLNVVFKEMEAMKSNYKIRKGILLQWNKNENNQILQIQIQRNKSIIRYFSVKISLFQQNLEKVKQIIRNQCILLKTFKRIVRFYEQKRNIQLLNFLPLKDEKLYGNLQQIDQIFFLYEISKQNNPSLIKSLDYMLQICESDTLFVEVWREKIWKENIFYLIDIYSQISLEESPRKKIIDKVYNQICPLNKIQPTYVIKFRSVLLYYYDFFVQSRNVIILQKILAYFVLLWDDNSREKVEYEILQICESQGKLINYIRENFKYFLGKLVILNRSSFVYCERNINRMQKLQNQLYVTQQPNFQLIQQIKLIINFMKKLKLLSYNLMNYIQLQQIREELAKNKFFALGGSEEISRFIDSILVENDDNSVDIDALKRKNFFANIYLRSCYFQKLVLKIRGTEDVLQLKKLLEEDKFSREFYTFSYLSYFTSSEKLKNTICADYLYINSDQFPFFNQDYVKAVVMKSSITEAQNYALESFLKFQLKEINNLTDLTVFKISLVVLFSAFMNPELNQPHVHSQILSDILESFLQYTEDMVSLTKSSVSEQNNTISQTKYMYSHRLLKLLLFLYTKKYEDGLEVLMKLLDGDRQSVQSGFEIYFLFRILEGKVSQNSRLRVRKCVFDIVLKVDDILRFKMFSVVPRSFQIVTQTYRGRNEWKSVMQQYQKFCYYLYQKNYSFADILFATMQKFISTCKIDDLNFIIEKGLHYELKEFIKCPSFSFLFLLAYVRLHFEAIQISSELAKSRTLLISIYFIDKFSEGFFRQYKVYLLSQNCRLKISKINRLKLKRTLANQHNLKFLLDSLSKMKKNDKKVQNKQSISQYYEKIKRKLKLFYQNKNQKY